MPGPQHVDSLSIHQFAYVSGSDPGAVGASKAWINTGLSPYKLNIRNLANSAWEEVGIYDGDLVIISNLTPGSGNVLQRNAGAWAARTFAQVKTSLSLNNVPDVDATSRKSHTGTQLAVTIKDFEEVTDARIPYRVITDQMTDDWYVSGPFLEWLDLAVLFEFSGIYTYEFEVFHETDDFSFGGGVQLALANTVGKAYHIGHAVTYDTVNPQGICNFITINTPIMVFPVGPAKTVFRGTLFMPRAAGPFSVPTLSLQAAKAFGHSADLIIRAGSNITAMRVGTSIVTRDPTTEK